MKTFYVGDKVEIVKGRYSGFTGEVSNIQYNRNKFEIKYIISVPINSHKDKIMQTVVYDYYLELLEPSPDRPVYLSTKYFLEALHKSYFNRRLK